MDIKKGGIAGVATDRQNGLSSDKGVASASVGHSVREGKSVENIEYRLEKSKGAKISIGALYGCLCHQAMEDVRTSGSSDDQD